MRRILAVAVLVIACGIGQPAGAGTIEDWAAALEARNAGEASAGVLRAELAARAGDASPIERWRRLARGEGSPQMQAADALALVESIFPNGDPARWEDVTGFWQPADVPRPLAAFDAVFYGARALLAMKDDRAPWLARSLVESLAASDRGRTLAFRTAPAEARDLLKTLEILAPPPPIGGWPSGVAKGTLPFAHGVSGWITESRATMRDMTFLNAGGVPVGGMGVYAWDREKGRIYRVIDQDNGRIWLFDDD